MRNLCLAAAGLSCGIAQNLGFETPSAGFVHNAATAAVHRISGIPGASRLGPAVLTGVQSASVSRDADAAVAVTPDGVFTVIGLRSGSPQWQSLGGGTSYLVSWGQSAGIAYSSGAYAVLSRTGEAWMPLNIGLPDGTVTAIDFDESGQRVLIGLTAQDSTAGAYIYSLRDGSLQQALSMPNPISITHAREQVFVLDGGTQAIWSVSDRVALSIELATDSRLIGLAASLDGNRLYAADAGLQQVAVYDLSGTSVAHLPVNAMVSKLERLVGGSSLLLNNDAGQPVYLLNDTANPQIFFVPALRVAADGGDGQ